MNGQFSSVRVTFAFLGVYTMNAFSLIHYNREKELWFISLFWNLFLLLAIVTNAYNYITGENIFLGVEQEFILMLRILVFILVVIQIYLPYSHYKRYKEITYLSYVWIFSGVNFFVYIYQTVFLEELDFNVYIFYSIWFLIFEILVIALGISVFTVREKKKRIEMVQKNAFLQRDARVLQFEVQERERKRIASELHDDILNRLSVSLLLFRDKFVDVKAFKQTLLTIAEDITLYTQGIYPVLTETNSIQSLIDQNIRPLAESKGLKLEFDAAKLSFEPNAFTQLHVFRLIQEFVKNAVSHGNASYVQIKLEHDKNSLKLFLSDNGQGYNMESTLPGLGTESARNRVQILGGALKIYSELGKGVQWRLSLPQN
jgi:signal transduction histidine kinase